MSLADGKCLVGVAPLNTFHANGSDFITQRIYRQVGIAVQPRKYGAPEQKLVCIYLPDLLSVEFDQWPFTVLTHINAPPLAPRVNAKHLPSPVHIFKARSRIAVDLAVEVLIQVSQSNVIGLERRKRRLLFFTRGLCLRGQPALRRF